MCRVCLALTLRSNANHPTPARIHRYPENEDYYRRTRAPARYFFTRAASTLTRDPALRVARASSRGKIACTPDGKSRESTYIGILYCARCRSRRLSFRGNARARARHSQSRCSYKIATSRKPLGTLARNLRARANGVEGSIGYFSTFVSRSPFVRRSGCRRSYIHSSVSSARRAQIVPATRENRAREIYRVLSNVPPVHRPFAK